MAKRNGKSVRQVVYEVGGMMHTGGDVLQTIATPRTKLVDEAPPLFPIKDEDALFLVDTMALIRHFGWTAKVGTTLQVRFDTPLPRVGDTFSLKGAQLFLHHLHKPEGKKVPTVELSKEVMISRKKLPDTNLLRLIEMDCTVDAKGRLCLTPYPGLGFAYAAFEQPQPSALWQD